MRPRGIELVRLVAVLGALILGAPALAQYREYFIRGKVVDPQKQPLPEVEIRLVDVATSRSFHMKTGKDGAFKFAGLPHGVYKATFSKEGYPPRVEDWKFEAPQDTMQRVEIPDVVLASGEHVEKVQRIKEAESGVKDATEKLRKGDLDGAITLLEGVLGKDPRDVNARFLIGLGYAGKGLYREAIAALSQVTELSPAFPGADYELGVCYKAVGDLPKALESYDRSLKRDPGHADSAYNSGLILFETNRIDEALARFELAVAVKPKDPEVLEMIGRCYIHQTRFEGAIEYLEKARAACTDPAKIAFLDELIRKARAEIR